MKSSLNAPVKTGSLLKSNLYDAPDIKKLEGELYPNYRENTVKQGVKNEIDKPISVPQKAKLPPPISSMGRKLPNIGATHSRTSDAIGSIAGNTVGAVQLLPELFSASLKDSKAARTTYKPLNDEMAQAFADIETVRAQYGDWSPEFKQAKQKFTDLEANVKATKTVLNPNSAGMKTMADANQLKERALEGTGGAGRWLGENVIGIADNIAALPTALLHPSAPLAVMGVKAAGSKAYELTKQGVPASQALSRSIISGGIEALTEKIPLDEVFKLGKTGGKSFVKNLLKQSGIEATEEMSSYALNYLADKLAQDPNARFDVNELINAGLGGAFSGFVMGGGATTVGRTSNAIARATTDSPGKAADMASRAGATGGAKYSIQTDAEGAKYVEVDTDQDIFDGIDAKDYPKIAKDYIIQRFRENSISLSGEGTAGVTARSAKEYAYPKNNLVADSKNAKMRASTELDNLVAVSEYSHSSKDDGRHPFASLGWDYYKTKFTIDGKTFSGLVNIAKSDKGKLLYDVTQIKRLPYNGIANAKASTLSASVGKSNNTNIPQGNNDVNSQYMRSGEDNAGFHPYEGRTVLENKGEVDFNTLDDKQTGVLNSVFKVAKSDEKTPTQVIEEMEEYPLSIVKQATEALKSEYAAYQGRGVAISQNNTRLTNNDKWYSDLYAEIGRTPSKTEKMEYAARMIEADIAAERGEFVSPQTAKTINMARSLKSALVKVGDGAAEVYNEGDKTVVTREIVGDMPPATVNRISAIAKRLGVSVGFDDSISENGSYAAGVIKINPRSKTPVLNTFVHELTHHLETSGSYNDFANLVMDSEAFFNDLNDQNLNAAEYRQQIKDLYLEQKGQELDDLGANREIVAKFSEKFLTDEKTIARLAQTDVTMFGRIKQWIEDMVVKFRGTSEEKGLLKIQKMYAKAAGDTGKQSGGVQYSIVDSQEYGLIARLDEKLIVPQNGEKMSQAIKRVFSERFKGQEIQVIQTGDNVVFDKIGKYLYPGTNAENMAKKKLAANILDDIIRTGTNKKHSPDLHIDGQKKNHSGLDAANGWDYYDVKFAVDNSGTVWGGRAVVRKSKNGNDYFYDLDKIAEVGRSDVSKLNPIADNATSVIDSVSYDKTAVNSQYMQTPQNNSPQGKTDMAAALEKAGTAKKGEQYSLENPTIEELNSKYGTIEPGEKPAREIALPKRTAKEQYVSKYARTMAEADITNDATVDLIKKDVESGRLSHEVVSDKTALAYAENLIEAEGFKDAVKIWDGIMRGDTAATKNTLALGQTIYNQAVQNKDVTLVKKMIGDLVVQFGEAGRNLQAARLLKRLTPDGRLYTLERSVMKINQDLQRKFGEKFSDIEIPNELAQDLLNATDSKQTDIAIDAIQQYVADQIPATWQDKLNAWRYLSMLGNIRTHIRNIVGNMIFVPVRHLKNVIGTGLEIWLPQAQRTKTVYSDKRSRAFAENDFDNFIAEIKGESKYDVASGVQDKRSIFKTGWLEGARKKNFAWLEAEDSFFLKRAYISSMAQAMKARGLTAAYLYSNTGASNAALSSVREYAINEAQKATYRDANAAAAFISRTKRAFANKAQTSESVGGKLAYGTLSVASEGILPFAKTPANIIKRGMEYSPAGLLTGTANLLTTVKKGKMSANQALDQIASGLSGTAIMVLGAMLAHFGVISGGGDEDKDQEALETLQGAQNYALTIGDISYTVDWAAPVSLPFFVGAELYNAIFRDGGKTFPEVIQGFMRITEPMFELSMLQGINGAIKSASYSESNPVTSIALNTLQNYAGQYVPTLLGQVARTVDPVRRDAYSYDKNSQIPKDTQILLQKQMAKIPGASKLLPPRLNQWGKPQAENNVAMRIFQNFLSPGYVSKKSTLEVDKEIGRLYKETGLSEVLPAYARKTITVNGKEKHLTPQEFAEYAEIKGEMSFDQVDKLIKKLGYKMMKDGDRATLIASVYSYATAFAKTKVSDYEMTTAEKKIFNASKAGVSPAQYLAVKAVTDKNENGSISQAEMQEALDKTDFTREQKALIFAQQNSVWKTNPYR